MRLLAQPVCFIPVLNLWANLLNFQQILTFCPSILSLACFVWNIKKIFESVAKRAEENDDICLFFFNNVYSTPTKYKIWCLGFFPQLFIDNICPRILLAGKNWEVFWSVLQTLNVCQVVLDLFMSAISAAIPSCLYRNSGTRKNSQEIEHRKRKKIF